MTDVRGSVYDLDALRRGVPDDRGELFLGFTPWSEDCEQWTRSVAEALVTSGVRSLSRTVWDNPAARGSRVLIDVMECASAMDAIDALAERLATNQLARLPQGNRDLGAAAFTHPEGVPPAVFFARGNVSISVISFGSQNVPVAPWAARLNRRLGERPKTDRAVLALEPDRRALKPGEDVVVRHSVPWSLGPEGYFKFFATGGTLTLRETAVVLRGTRAGEARVDAFAVEPGREPHTGSLTLIVE